MRPLLDFLSFLLYSSTLSLSLSLNSSQASLNSNKFADLEIELPALQLKGHEIGQSNQESSGVGLLEEGPSNIRKGAQLTNQSHLSSKRSAFSLITLLSRLVGEKRKLQNEVPLEYESEPRRKNRNRDFQTNGW